MSFLPFCKGFRAVLASAGSGRWGGQRALLARAAMFLGYDTGGRTPRAGVQGQPVAVGGL